MLQLHLSYQQFYSLLRCDLYWRFYGNRFYYRGGRYRQVSMKYLLGTYTTRVCSVRCTAYQVSSRRLTLTRNPIFCDFFYMFDDFMYQIKTSLCLCLQCNARQLFITLPFQLIFSVSYHTNQNKLIKVHGNALHLAQMVPQW